MIVFSLYKNGLYLADPSNSSAARVGFLFQDGSRTDPTFELSQESWTNPDLKGYFAFFTPSSDRDWDAFATSVRTVFTQTQTSQFGWFADSGATVSATTLILVTGQGTSTPSVQSPFTLQFNNIALSVQASVFSAAGISFDDASNDFRIQNANHSTLQLTVKPPSQSQQTLTSSSDYLSLPMDDTSNPNAGSVNAAFALNVQQLAYFEAGFMYFGPGSADRLTALGYPTLRPSAGATALACSVWLDVLEPLSDTRSYFQLTDSVVGSYFVSNVGQAFTLNTVGGSDVGNVSRYVLANRPISSSTDTGTYYLSPAGSFGLGIATVSSDSGEAASPSANLLCGVTGTEFLTATIASGSADSLFFQPAQPAYQISDSGDVATDDPVFLSSEAGNVTTSWVQFTTSTGNYVSQPQSSPLYQQSSDVSARVSGTDPASGLKVYLLDFLPLPTWAPGAASAESDAQATAVSGPLVPMVPYAGLSSTTDTTPFLEMESKVLNPTRKNAFSNAQSSLTAARPKRMAAADADETLTFAMTPQGLLAGLDAQNVWTTTQIATSPALDPAEADVTLQFTEMGDQIRQSLQQNQIFTVISTLTDSADQPLFQFSGSDQTVNIAGWPFSLSPAGTPASDSENTPPILIQKFYPGQSIASLVDDLKFWSQPNVFNNAEDFSAKQAQAYIQGLIQSACEAVYGEGNCPDGTPSGTPDTTSLYYNFYQVVTNPDFSGILALNANMQLNELPTAIKAVTGGMIKDGEDGPESNIAAFRVHHVGVEINDTDPDSATPSLAQSSLFGLVDYENASSDESDASDERAAASSGLDVSYNFEVEYLRALFVNSELRDFSCEINLTINNLFDTDVQKEDEGADDAKALASGEEGDDADEGNVIVITGAYQAHSTSGDDDTSGQGTYSFTAAGEFVFNFDENPYLDNITLTKLQFSFDQEIPDTEGSSGDSVTSNIKASFAIWGSMTFKDLEVLDIFSFEKLTFADLGITVSFNLTIPAAPNPPTTDTPVLTFSPGNLRFDVSQSPPKEGSTSMLSLLPFKLTSFLYSENADQTVQSLEYFSLSSIPGQSVVKDTFNFALLFDLDLGSLGALVGDLSAFKFSVLVGWLSGSEGGIAFGIQLPQADGKLVIKIQGVLELNIQEFKLQYVSGTDEDTPAMLVLAMHNSFMTLLGQRLPPGEALFDFALFVPFDNPDKIGWIAAINNQPGADEEGGDDTLALGSATTRSLATAEDDSGVFELVYLGGGQRVGPDPASPPTTFADFLSFMTDDFWTAVKDGDYASVYHPESQWLVLSDFKLLGMIEIGFVFYDVTPFYSLTINVTDLFNFEITYTKISDSIGLFYAMFSLPDSLRTFQVGAASLTLPSIAVSVYTNGDWKLDVGFPKGDDWSGCFKVEAFAGPVPVTGSGGFYIASLSSATSSIFTGDYPSILAFGFAARMGVGKDFTSGPLSAGISVTFFGIIEGAAGYLVSSSDEMFKKPDALSLQGQFGVIGEIYGAVDFGIIKASVNVTLQASIGINLLMEFNIPGSGTILLYIDASVKVSVKVKIDLGLFSVSISFSFRESFRFEWELAGGNSVSMLRVAHSARLMAVPTVLPLCSGLSSTASIWFLPETTVIFPAATGVGDPWFVTSLGIEYDPAPASEPTYADFKPFEAVTTQLVTWAIGYYMQATGSSFDVTIDELTMLDQTPDILVGWIDYPTLLQQLAVFSAPITVPSGTDGQELYATTFPMLPFLNFKTTGRVNGSGAADDLDYQFQSKNLVSESYIEEVDAYLNQLFVNQQQAADSVSLASTESTTPLVQEIFLNYFTGLIRGATHQMLETMQNGQIETSPINDLIMKTVGEGLFASLAGQMSSSFRGGSRLPYVSGLTIPSGTPDPETNPLYALLWQEIPVGSFGSGGQYTVALTNPDTEQTWVTANVNWDVTEAATTPYQQVDASSIQAPTTPTQLPFTDTGPQSFAFENPVEWTQPGDIVASYRPFPSNLTKLQSTEPGDISVLVESRETGAAYLPGGTPLDPSAFTWVTSIELTVSQIPAGSGTESLSDVFALNGASQSDQALLEQVLRALETDNPIASIQVLYQESAGATGLNSDAINAADVFVLRTNTTTVSAPPASVNMLPQSVALTANLAVSVGAQIDDDSNFLQIVQQAAVTNAAGYYLRYQDTEGASLPTELFSSGPAPLTILISYKADGTENTDASPAQVKPYYNGIVLSDANASLHYYAETTNPVLNTQYASVAAGSVGVELSRNDSVMLMEVSAELSATCDALDTTRKHHRHDLLNALLQAGVRDPRKVNALLADSGSADAQLNSLYSLISYQVEATDGFIKSNLSAPLQPQQPDDDSADESDDRTYRVFAPLYNLAAANQPLTANPPPNRYASIGDPFSIDFFQNDAFGNAMPNTQNFSGSNYYFDPIVPVDQWQGVVSTYDFLDGTKPVANSFTVYLSPSAVTFTAMSTAQADSALQTYYTILDQITGPGVSFAIETNFALQADGSMVSVTLSSEQASAIVAMVKGIVSYLENFTEPAQSFEVEPVSLTVAVTGSGVLPPVFEMSALLGIQRDVDLISPLLKDSYGNVTFPSAQVIETVIAPTVGASLDSGAGSVSIDAFAANFVAAFPALALSVGLGGATQSQSPSTATRARRYLKKMSVSSDGSGSSGQGAQSLWAVQQSLFDVSIGVASGGGSSPGPFYASPKPLDNTLNSAVVPLPDLPASIKPSTWPASQLFSDVDLDGINRSFFQAVDNFLGPASSSQAFELARDAYTAVAYGRESLAEEYTGNEVDWLFSPQAPFTGTSAQLEAGRETFDQQMRAALSTAYTVDTLVQYTVAWNSTLPAGIGDMYSLFGGAQPTGGQDLPKGYSITASEVPIVDGGDSLLTFLFGSSDIEDEASVTLDLEFNVTHVQYYLEPASSVPTGEARPSVWLQLVNPYPDAPPHIGPVDTETTIPLVFRQFPTPPTIISQLGISGTSSSSSSVSAAEASNPLTAAAAWHCVYRYQSQLTPHDQLINTITYNTDLSASTDRDNSVSLQATDIVAYSLFDALARFSATYAVIGPILANLADPDWATAAGVFSSLVTDVVNNTDWNDSNALYAARLQKIVNEYVIVDSQDNGSRMITLTWDPTQGESSFSGATLAIQAIGPDGKPYPGQIPGTVTNGITDIYSPSPAIVNDWVTHEIEVDALNVLSAENALVGTQIERNLIEMSAAGSETVWTSQNEFIYKTPIVRATQPVTPFVDNSVPIQVADLPNQSMGTGCPVSTSSDGLPTLCQRIYTLMYDLLSDPDELSNLTTARGLYGLDETAVRRVKVSCSLQYPVAAAAGGSVALDPISPLYPVTMARSFLIDSAQTEQLDDFSMLYAQQITNWSAGNSVAFGAAATPASGQLVFDITLYAQISGLNTPVLRLRNLQLKLSEISES